MRDYGLTFTIKENKSFGFIAFDDEIGTLINSWEFNVPVGSVFADLSNLNLSKIPELIRSAAAVVNTDANEESSQAIIETLRKNLIKEYGYACGQLLTANLNKSFKDYLIDKNVYFKKINDRKYRTYRKDIFKGTTFVEFGDETIEQLFLTFSSEIYYIVLKVICHLVRLFESGFYRIRYHSEMISDYIDEIFANQNITYAINIVEDDVLEEIAVKDLYSMLTIEIAKITEMKITFNKCMNCNRYFVPKNRTDTMYCDRISPQDHSKTCQTYAQYMNYLRKTQNDKATKLYKQIYNSKANKTKRSNAEYGMKDLIEFREKAKEYRSKVKSGTITEDEYVDWLMSFK